jgi:hypothetical protein
VFRPAKSGMTEEVFFNSNQEEEEAPPGQGFFNEQIK